MNEIDRNGARAKIVRAVQEVYGDGYSIELELKKLEERFGAEELYSKPENLLLSLGIKTEKQSFIINVPQTDNPKYNYHNTSYSTIISYERSNENVNLDDILNGFEKVSNVKFLNNETLSLAFGKNPESAEIISFYSELGIDHQLVTEIFKKNETYHEDILPPDDVRRIKTLCFLKKKSIDNTDSYPYTELLLYSPEEDYNKNKEKVSKLFSEDEEFRKNFKYRGPGKLVAYGYFELDDFKRESYESKSENIKKAINYIELLENKILEIDEVINGNERVLKYINGDLGINNDKETVSKASLRADKAKEILVLNRRDVDVKNIESFVKLKEGLKDVMNPKALVNFLEKKPNLINFLARNIEYFQVEGLIQSKEEINKIRKDILKFSALGEKALKFTFFVPPDENLNNDQKRDYILKKIAPDIVLKRLEKAPERLKNIVPLLQH